jgi:outer membrane protein assembly factor BamB
MLKQNYLIALIVSALTVTLASCDLGSKAPSTGEPSYSARVVWESDTRSSDEICLMLDGDALYTFETTNASPYYHWLTKLDAKTGTVLWRSEEQFPGLMVQCQPVVFGEYVYFFMGNDLIYRLHKETGTLSSITKVDIENRPLVINDNVIVHDNYLYFGIGNYRVDNYFVRIDINTIQGSENPHDTRLITPEIIWRPKSDRSISSVPVIKDNVVYVHTFAGDSHIVELAGINVDTKEVVFYTTFGTREDGLVFENGIMTHSLYIHGDVLYFLSSSFAAYNLKNGQQLYQKLLFTDGSPESLARVYPAWEPIDATFYNGRFYYTTLDSVNSGLRNIHCIDADTGELVWNDTAPNSESLGTNPIITHGRMYVPQFVTGLRVYNPDTGSLIGVDASFAGYGTGRNILYNDLMITSRTDRVTYDRRIVAIYVGK